VVRGPIWPAPEPQLEEVLKKLTPKGLAQLDPLPPPAWEMKMSVAAACALRAVARTKSQDKSTKSANRGSIEFFT